MILEYCNISLSNLSKIVVARSIMAIPSAGVITTGIGIIMRVSAV